MIYFFAEDYESLLYCVGSKKAFLNMQSGRGIDVKLRASERASLIDGDGKKSVGELTGNCHVVFFKLVRIDAINMCY